MAGSPTPQADQIPVTVLTGFLGSGKTTALNALLGLPRLDGTLAIINEFGEIGLDHLLIEVSQERLALLDNGCVCCTVRDDLIETLKAIDKRRGSPDLPPVDRVILETTGLADPAPILHALMIDPDLAEKYRIDGVVVTVDAVNGAATLDAHEQARKQLAVADRVLLTKTDIATPGQAEAARARIAAINGTAEVREIIDGAVSVDDMLGVGAFAQRVDGDRFAAWADDILRRVTGADHAATCSHPGCAHPHHHHGHDHHAHGHTADIATYAFVLDEPVQWSAFRQWLDYITALKGNDLLRVKGLVQIAEHPGQPLVLHGVQHVFHPPRRLEAWPTDDHRTRLVFIVRNIPRAAIEKTMSRFASVAPERIRGAAVA